MTENGKDMFNIEFDEKNSTFNIRLFNKTILGSCLTARIGKQKALMTGMLKSEGSDDLGKYEVWTVGFCSPKNKKRKFEGTIRKYDDCVIFEMKNKFSMKGRKKKNLFGHPYISFPSFEGEEWNDGCSVLTYKRQAPFNFPVQWKGRVVDSLREGKNSPLIVMNEEFETLVLSPLNNLLYSTVSISHHPKMVRCGLPRALKVIPRDTVDKIILVMGKGINRTIDRWGRILGDYHGVGRIPKDGDILLKYLSYWTNAGSAYWYNTQKKTSYEQTLTSLADHHKKTGLEFGSYELDSWWYKKEGDMYTSGITSWDLKKTTRSKNFNSLFPVFQRYRELDLFQNSDLSHIQTILDKPVGCHFKQLANNSKYVQESPEDFLVESFPVPRDLEAGEKLFSKIFDRPDWNMKYIVHDWLQWMNDKHSAFRDIEAGSAYFKALDNTCKGIKVEGNELGHLTVQLCMTQPHMTLNSVSMESVTSIRSTSDSNSFFIEGTYRWWWHLYSSKLIQALGKYPFYDNRLSYKNHIFPFSAYSKFEFIWLGLSCGPIGIGDPMGKENVKLIRRVVKSDGEIIKPDIPCVPLDKCYLYNSRDIENDKGVTVFSHSDLKIHDSDEKIYRVFYFLTFNVHPFARRVDASISIMDTGLERNRKYILYDFFRADKRLVEDRDINVYSLKRREFYYHIAAPLVSGFAVLGNVSKHVSCSSQLIKSLSIDEKSAEIIFFEDCGRHERSKWRFYSEMIPKEILVNGKECAYIFDNNIIEVEIGIGSNDTEAKETGKMTIYFEN